MSAANRRCPDIQAQTVLTGRLVAIDSGHLGGAAFDVYPEEPVDFGHRLFALAREGRDLVLTPHIAGASRETAERAATGVAEEVRRFLAGEPALHPLVEGEPPFARSAP